MVKDRIDGLEDFRKQLEAAGPDILAFTSFPETHWRQIWSNIPRSV